MFVSQSPVGRDALFEKFPGFLAPLELIASHITHPAITGEPSLPMTFAVYGRWGAGKSTALAQLEALVEDELDGAAGTLTTSTYSAPTWEQTSSPRTSLAYTILDVIDPDAVFRAVRDPSDPHVDDDQWTAARFLRLAEMIDDSPALQREWMNRISTHLRPVGEPGGKQHVHVVLIDDIDRCSPEFTARLLAATSIWDARATRNIFFVIAANRDHLIESLREHLPLGAHTAEEALEKYVHLDVTVPRMLSTAPEVSAYLDDLCDDVRSQSLSSLHINLLRGLIAESGAAHPHGVMAPLLTAPTGEAGTWLTPRAVKHRFNTFLAEFHPRGAELDPQDVKRWVVKAFWPDFWWTYIWPRETTPPGEVPPHGPFLENLVELGELLLPLWGLSREQLQPALNHLAAKSALAIDDIDPALAMYLAAEPRLPLDLAADETAPPPPPRSERGLESAEPDSPANGILLLRFEVDRAREEGRDDDARAMLTEIVKLSHDPSLGTDASPIVGNAALQAEALQLRDIARELHRRALELDPKHFNVVQNFVEFVIDNSEEDLLPIAVDLVALLKGEGRFHRPERTVGLEAQLGMLTARSPDEKEVARDRLLAWASAEGSIESFIRVVSMNRDTNPTAATRHLGRTIAEHASDDRERYVALRLLADHLGRSTDPADEREAVDIYHFVLDRGLACIERDGDTYSVLHNLSGLYASLDYTRRAATIRAALYEERPMEPAARRSFAVLLDRLDEDRAGAAVLQGQALPDMDLRPEPVPRPLANGIDRWWERLPIGDYPSCLSPALDAALYHDTRPSD